MKDTTASNDALKPRRVVNQAGVDPSSTRTPDELGGIFISSKFDEGKNYAVLDYKMEAILYDSQVKHERVLEDAPLFFVDLDRGVRGMMDCLCDADLARVGYERPKFRAARKAPLDTLGILDGSVEDPNKRMSASERLRMEARDVWSEDELEYPEVRLIWCRRRRRRPRRCPPEPF